jgi:hypothetical protein
MRTKDSEYEQLDKPRWLLSVLDGFSEFIMKENSKKKNKWYFWFYFRKGKCPQNKP